jgi:hypothetical protein
MKHVGFREGLMVCKAEKGSLLRQVACALGTGLVLVATLGCTERRAFDSLRQYLGSHDPKGRDAAQLAVLLSPLCTKNGIATLLDAADSKCIEDSVSARVALGLMFGQGPNDDYWVRLKRGVDWDRLSIETDRMMNRTNDIGGVWRSWLSVADSDLKSGLGSQKSPPARNSSL